MNMDQLYKYLQKFHKYHFLFLKNKVSHVNHICKALIMGTVSLMFWTPYKVLDLLDSQSTQTNLNSYQYNVSPTEDLFYILSKWQLF